jgi:hypothetical protein
MPLEEVPGVQKDTTDRALVLAVVAVRPAWDLEAGDSVVVVAVAGGAGRDLERKTEI